LANSSTLIYVHDPMCSWCWGFRPTLKHLCSLLPQSIKFERLLGGLAADNDQAMPEEMQKNLQATWQRIQHKIPGTEFNFDFWRQTKPRRSTYPACRAVLTAKTLNPALEDSMILAIQQAYYTRALNPSDEQILINLAGEIGLQKSDFGDMLNSPDIKQQLTQEIERSGQIGARSYPALILKTGENSYWPVGVNYTNAQAMLETIEMLSQ